MKAILVIDVPDDMRIEDTLALNVSLYNGLSVHELSMYRPLKPLPNAIKERGKWISEEYQKGWNAFRENLE